jgi:alkyl hydroperoxide reductase subunit F
MSAEQALHLYDVAIVGAGPAGLTAAVYAARKQLDVIMITMDIGGQTNLTADIANYMGFEYISGAELARKFQEQVEQFPITIRLGALVKTLTPTAGPFRLVTTDGEALDARTVIISTGKHSRKLGVPGEKELVGRGVSYCATCDGPFFKGQPVLVVGGGNSGVEAALALSKVASQVTILEVLDRWRADAILLEQAQRAPNLEWLLHHRLVEIRGEDQVRGALVESLASGEQRELAVQGVFIEIGLIPNTEWLGDLVQLNQWKEIQVDCATATSVTGIFAAGDVTSIPHKQIIVAAGDGAKAALSAYDYLLQQGAVQPQRDW